MSVNILLSMTQYKQITTNFLYINLQTLSVTALHVDAIICENNKSALRDTRFVS